MRFKNKLISSISIAAVLVFLLCQTLMAASAGSTASQLNNDSDRLSAAVYGTHTGNEVTGVSLDKKELILAIGKRADLKATVTPSTAANKTITWFSSDQSVVRVNDKGSVIAVNSGSAKIFVVTRDGDKVAACKVTVPAIPVSSVTLNKKTATVKVKKTLQLTASVKPDNATDKSVKWSSSSTSIATVDAKGLVTGKKAGKATITATTNNGKKVTTCIVTITK